MEEILGRVLTQFESLIQIGLLACHLVKISSSLNGCTRIVGIRVELSASFPVSQPRIHYYSRIRVKQRPADPSVEAFACFQIVLIACSFVQLEGKDHGFPVGTGRFLVSLAFHPRDSAPEPVIPSAQDKGKDLLRLLQMSRILRDCVCVNVIYTYKSIVIIISVHPVESGRIGLICEGHTSGVIVFLHCHHHRIEIWTVSPRICLGHQHGRRKHTAHRPEKTRLLGLMCTVVEVVQIRFEGIRIIFREKSIFRHTIMLPDILERFPGLGHITVRCLILSARSQSKC